MKRDIEMNLKVIGPLMLIPLILILAANLLTCAAHTPTPASDPTPVPALVPAQPAELPKIAAVVDVVQDATPREVEEEATTPIMEPQHKDQLFGLYPCSAEHGTLIFTSAIFPPDLITEILPMGKMAQQSGHVTPTDHLYIHRDAPLGEDVNYVVAPADGYIVDIARFSQDRPLDWDNPLSPMVPDYRLIFMHSCKLFTIFIHLGELAPAVAEKVGQIPLNGRWAAMSSEPIEVKAGEPIAKYGATNLDWSVHDVDTTLAGFVVPEHYETEPWKIHTVDPFQFYSEPIKSDLLSKIPRTVEPRAGKIDYDIEGTIVGNWFMDGTVDYSGNVPPSSEYWQGHLSIVYGFIDPTQIHISIGFDIGINSDLCPVCGGLYGVRGNQPDPATVGPDSGIVKYELMSRKNEGPGGWLVKEQVGDTSLGTFLVQHMGDRTIRIEVILGKAPNEVSGFSDASLVYRR
jgi:hypothetical protein